MAKGEFDRRGSRLRVDLVPCSRRDRQHLRIPAAGTTGRIFRNPPDIGHACKPSVSSVVVEPGQTGNAPAILQAHLEFSSRAAKIDY